MNAVVWEAARASGFTSFVLLTLSVAIGLLLSGRWKLSAPRVITNGLHEFTTLLALVFTAVHVLAVLVDPFTRFGFADVLVPFVDSYRPLWTGLGIVALYLLLAVLISSWLRGAIGYAWWRRLHGLAFGVYALATAHGLGAGSDTGTPWAAALYASSVLLVGGVTAFRLMEPHGRAARRRPVAAALVAFAMGAGVVWLTGSL